MSFVGLSSPTRSPFILERKKAHYFCSQKAHAFFKPKEKSTYFFSPKRSSLIFPAEKESNYFFSPNAHKTSCHFRGRFDLGLAYNRMAQIQEIPNMAHYYSSCWGGGKKVWPKFMKAQIWSTSFVVPRQNPDSHFPTRLSLHSVDW